MKGKPPVPDVAEVMMIVIRVHQRSDPKRKCPFFTTVSKDAIQFFKSDNYTTREGAITAAANEVSLMK